MSNIIFLSMFFFFLLCLPSRAPATFQCERLIEAHHDIQDAISRAHPGDCVIIYPGEYFEDLRTVRSGLPGKPIVILGLPGAVIHGAPSRGGRVIHIAHSHILLEGLEIDGHFSRAESPGSYKDKLIYVEGNPWIRGVRIVRNILRNALGECLRVKRAEKVEIEGNHISFCGLRDFRFDRGRKNGEAIYIGTAPEQTTLPDNTREVEIVRNILLPHGSECVDVKEGSSEIIIRDNTCAYTVDPLSGGISVRGNRVTIEGNFFYHLAGAGVRLGGDGPKDGIMNRVLGNFFLEKVRISLKIMRGPQEEICGNWARTPRLYVGPDVASRFEEAFKPCK